MLDVSDPTPAMQAAYIVALAIGLYLTWHYNQQLVAVLTRGNDEAAAARAYRAMQRWQRAAYWCGRHALAAEVRYRELVD